MFKCLNQKEKHGGLRKKVYADIITRYMSVVLNQQIGQIRSHEKVGSLKRWNYQLKLLRALLNGTENKKLYVCRGLLQVLYAFQLRNISYNCR